MERRSAPIIILSFAFSSKSRLISLAPVRAAINAASLTRFSRSAPEKPGVPRARTSRSTWEDILVFLAYISSIFFLPPTSGTGTTTCRSKRPGRSRAGSRTSGLLVAATIMTPSFVSKPSISTSSWFKVCSLSSCPPPSPAPR